MGDNGNNAVQIKSNGAVVTPSQPYIHYRVGTSLSYNNSAQNVTIPFNTSVVTVNGYYGGSYSTATGKITAYYTGAYEVSCGLEGANAVLQLWGVVNGVRTQTFAHGTGVELAGSTIFRLVAGDTFGVAGWFSGAATTISNDEKKSYLKIRYLG